MPIPPDCDLWQVFEGVGICQSVGMGAFPITAVELRAWQAGAHVRLSAWAFQTFLDMSRAYCAGSNDKTAPNQPDLVAHSLTIARREKNIRDSLNA